MDLTELIKVTKKGVDVFPLIYDSIEETDDERILLMEKNEKFTIYNVDYQIIGDSWYDKIGEFEEDDEGYFAQVYLDEKIGLIDDSGNEITPCVYEEIDDFDEDGLAIVKRDGLYGKINRQGTEIITAMFNEIE